MTSSGAVQPGRTVQRARAAGSGCAAPPKRPDEDRDRGRGGSSSSSPRRASPSYKCSAATRAPAMATLSVQSNPAGVPVFVDGIERGVTPARITLAPGPHILELRRGVPRVIPVTLTAGADVSQYLEFVEAPRARSRRHRCPDASGRRRPPDAAAAAGRRPARRVDHRQAAVRRRDPREGPSARHDRSRPPDARRRAARAGVRQSRR